MKITKNYMSKCPNCKIDFPLYVEVEESIDLEEGEIVVLERRSICLCGANIDEWATAERKNGEIKLSAGIKGFIVPSTYITINKRYE